ncbi:MAG: alpha/beta hydrolase [Propionibacteriaceae bacterium]|nr:alpha/beta hydrolase [Propionibacteriaceae bacterium]
MEQPSTRRPLASMISKWRSVLSRSGDQLPSDNPTIENTDLLAGGWSESWMEDQYLTGFHTRTYSMVWRSHLNEEPPGHLISTLIGRKTPTSRRAVLHIHGWNEYFFQPHLAEFFEDLGYDFYAVDLHRYGRSLQPGELPGYMESVQDYGEELDACVDFISTDHDSVMLSGHSTGGLIASLYTAERPGAFSGVILNSPWLDMQGSELMRAVTPILVRGLSITSPTMTMPALENPLYGQSLHQDFYGEWEYDLSLKRVESQPIRPGWVKAVVDGHDRVAQGLGIDCPVFVATSMRSSTPKQWCEDAHSTDLALDADRISARAPYLGRHTTLVRFEGGLHDVGLSRLEVRTAFFREIRQWVDTYVTHAQSATDTSGDHPPMTLTKPS